ncbi:RNA polymerase sigma-70 factor [Zhouia amylolytica]|uniref:RNA polymerase sigma-70 factor n=2 Tax=Zhouia amylolytica TaxID=376730 RepID=W2UJN0_9FLAO|nr:RNA polymerase sigma-70 factor [Zhouia amylolytica]ETN94355.1 hypothetical protein P278_22970 [Zhouia amylolytica AD3]
MKNNQDFLNHENFYLKLNSGDKSAHELLFKLYQNKLMCIAKSYISNKEDAEEIVQDVFIKIWNNKSNISIKNNLNGYLFTCTKNLCLDYLKKKKRKINREGRVLQLEAVVNYNALADEGYSELIEQELNIQIEKAIEQLPERCKLIFSKSRFEGMKYREISDELNISIKTVEHQIGKALKVMHLHLKDYLTAIVFFLLF